MPVHQFVVVLQADEEREEAEEDVTKLTSDSTNKELVSHAHSKP